MREILFKAKRIDNGKWVEGYYCKWLKGERIITYSEKETDCIITWMSNGGMSRYEVDPETLCQFTGLCDKNGKKIWENDICNALLAPMRKGFKDEKEKCVVKYGIREENFKIELGFWLEWMKTDYWRTDIGFWTENRELEVIGNIFDNPELLKGGNNE